MKSVIIRRCGGPEVVAVEDVPVPEPRSGEVRIEVHGSAINPIDLSARAGRLTAAGLMAPSPRFGLGWDVSGVVDAVGPDVTRWDVGDPVIGLRDLLFAPGAHAEQVVLHESAVASAPATVSAEEAAALPLSALTADRALRLTGVGRGDTLLVTGAAGAVGSYLLQLAAQLGVRTLALARSGDVDYLTDLGVAEVLTAAGDLGSAVRDVVPAGVDAVVDAAVLGIGAHDALRGEGTFVALVAPFAPPPIRGTTVVVQEVFADGARLGELAALVDAGLLTPRVATVVALAEARRGHELAERSGLRGKVVLRP